MDVAIVGLPQSGKTTVFRAATTGRTMPLSRPDRPTVGMAKVPEPRLARLAQIGNSAAIVEAEVRYVDLPRGHDDFSKSGWLSGEALAHLRQADVLVVVVRCFDNPAVPHVLDRVDPAADATLVLDELALTDLGIIERRLGRLADEMKGSRATERQAMQDEIDLLERLEAGLGNQERVTAMSLTAGEQKLVSGFGLLTLKPLVTVANMEDSQLGAERGFVDALAAAMPPSLGQPLVVYGLTEEELAAMEPVDAAEMREGLGIGESGSGRLIGACFRALNLITFLTVGPKEARAWAVQEGACAQECAAVIHTDIGKGFIRAEVATFEDFDSLGSEAAVRRAGRLRSEGKTYRVKDGDVVNFLFNV